MGKNIATSLDEFLEEKKDPCWKGYKQIGTKKKKNKEVPNCVPEDEKIDEKKDIRLVNAGVEDYNKPKRTPNHPTKSHIVVAKEGDEIKTIRFGEQGAETAGKPKEGESERMKNKRKSFKARVVKNIDN